jgi:hypothetical protein
MSSALADVRTEEHRIVRLAHLRVCKIASATAFRERSARYRVEHGPEQIGVRLIPERRYLQLGQWRIVLRPELARSERRDCDIRNRRKALDRLQRPRQRGRVQCDLQHRSKSQLAYTLSAHPRCTSPAARCRPARP